MDFKINIGPLTESGVCDDCASKGDVNPKLVKRILENDNLYLCSRHNIQFKQFNEDDYEDDEYDEC